MSKAAPPPPAAEGDVQFKRVAGGGMLPARELPARGPTQNRALMAGIDAENRANDRVGLHNAMQEQRNIAFYEEQARDAHDRKEAFEAEAAKRDHALQGLASDFDNTARELGQKKIDGERWWASQSTGEKIGWVLTVMLGALGGGGDHNVGFQAVVKNIDDDVAQQKFMYQTGLDQLNAQKTAFGLAAERYNSVDAANAIARAAALDYANQRLNVLQAEMQGTVNQNEVELLRGKIEHERQKTIAEGFRFVPAALQPGKYKMYIRGQEIPGYVSEHDAQKYTLEHGVKPGEKVEEELVKGGVQLQVKREENAAKRAERQDERAKFIATKEQEAKIPEREASIRSAREAHNKTPITGAERTFDWVAGKTPLGAATGFNFQESPNLYKFIHGREKAEREQAWKSVVVDVRHELAGANVTPEEERPIMAALEGANDQESRLFALKLADEKIQNAKRNIRGGASDSGAGYEENRAGVSQGQLGPSSLESIPSFNRRK